MRISSVLGSIVGSGLIAGISYTLIVNKDLRKKLINVWNRWLESINPLNPNRFNDLIVERFTFGLTQEIVIGEPSTIIMVQSPDATIRPQKVFSNSPCEDFIILSDIKMSNISVICGGKIDSYQFAFGSILDCPTIMPSNGVTVLGVYNGKIPKGFNFGDKYLFSLSFTGPCSVVS